MKKLLSWLNRASGGPRCANCGRPVRESSREIHQSICPEWMIDAPGTAGADAMVSRSCRRDGKSF